MDPNFQRLTEYPLPLSFSSTFAASTSSDTCSGDTWMNPRIWRRLPAPLINHVLALLPPPAFFRCRCVCKRWNNLLYNDKFLYLYLGISPSRPHWFLFFKAKPDNLVDDNNNMRAEGYLFDPYDLLWHRLPFPMVPGDGFTAAASSGGLVCWVSDNASRKILLLTNPLAGTLNQMPVTLTSRYQPSIGFHITPISIDVTIAGDDLFDNSFAVKNTTAECFHLDTSGLFLPMWQNTSILPRLCNFGPSGRMVHVNGRLYCMSYHPFSVAAYDMGMAIWWEILPPMKRYLKSPCLVESGTGKLLLISGIEKNTLIVPKSLRIWSLDDDDGITWVEIDRMPPPLYDVFRPEMARCGNVFHCVGHGEFIVFMIPGDLSCMGVMFNMKNREWKWIPPCPFVSIGDLGRGFAYEPRLTTPVTSLLHVQFPPPLTDG